MRAYIAGDKAAFEELFHRYASKLYAVLQRDLFRKEEARDLVQQTFLQLHRARHDFDTSAQLRPWLFTIALNLKREHLRRLKRRPEAPLDLDGRTDPRGPARGVLRYEASRDLRAALSELKPDQSEVIELHWFGELSFPEVAEVVGTTLSAVKVRAHRGYARLRELLSDPPEVSRDFPGAVATEPASSTPSPAASNPTDLTSIPMGRRR